VFERVKSVSSAFRAILPARKLMIALRRLQIDDLNAVRALISNMEVVRYMLFAVCSREEIEKFLTESINESLSAPWRSVVRAIVSGPGGELVGLCVSVTTTLSSRQSQLCHCRCAGHGGAHESGNGGRGRYADPFRRVARTSARISGGRHDL